MRNPSRGDHLAIGGDDFVEARLAVADEVHLVDRHHDVRARRACETMKEWRRVCGSTPLRASTRMIARSAVEAPVAMLRVYCSWPGVSATMKARRVGREIAIGDVDGDALLALGGEPVHQQGEIELPPCVPNSSESRSSASSWSSAIMLES